MRADAAPLKLSQEAGSISSTDTSEIGFGLPACEHQDPGWPLSAWSWARKDIVVKDREGET